MPVIITQIRKLHVKVGAHFVRNYTFFTVPLIKAPGLIVVVAYDKDFT